MQIELTRPAKPGPYAAAHMARPRRTSGTLTPRELRRIVAEMVD